MPTSSPLAEKLWLAAKIQGHRNPFGKPLTEYNVAELDFILEMAARDDPKAYVFRRGNTVSSSEVLAAWASVLTGPALFEWMRGKHAPRATEAWANRRRVALKPGLREGRAAPAPARPGKRDA